jgi:hypothetical protein
MCHDAVSHSYTVLNLTDPENPSYTLLLSLQQHYRSATATLDARNQPSQQRQAPCNPVYVALVAWANGQHSLRSSCYLCPSCVMHYVAGQPALQCLVC